MLSKSKLLTIVTLVVLLASACQPVVAPSAAAVSQAEAVRTLRSVTGDLFLHGVQEWGGIGISLLLDVKELNPETHEATGTVNWRNFMPGMEAGMPSWKVVDSEARYVLFGADFENGDPDCAIVIAQIMRKDGFGQGEPGEYAYMWFHDAGEAADEPDRWAMKYYSLDPFLEFFPEDAPPAVEFLALEQMVAEDPVLPISADVGDLTITQ